MSVIEISRKQVIRDLGCGMTRYKSQDTGLGSIEEKYGMEPWEVEIIFRDSQLKDVQTTAFRFRLVDDIDITVQTKNFVESPNLQPDFDRVAPVNKSTASLPLKPAVVPSAEPAKTTAIPNYMEDL